MRSAASAIYLRGYLLLRPAFSALGSPAIAVPRSSEGNAEDMMAAGVVTVFGGSGFIGRYVVQRLAQQGWIVRVAVRRPDRALFLKPMGAVGQITPIAADMRSERAVAAAVDGADAVVNLVGILYEKGGRSFEAIHVEGARAGRPRWRKAAGVEDLRADVGARRRSGCARPNMRAPRRRARRRCARPFPTPASSGPRIVFGPEDDFFNRFAAMARFAPALPLIGGGRTKFQPVYVGDVAEAILRCVEDPQHGRQDLRARWSRRLQLSPSCCGALLREIGRRRLLLPLPFGVARIQAACLELAAGAAADARPDQAAAAGQCGLAGRPDARGSGHPGPGPRRDPADLSRALSAGRPHRPPRPHLVYGR